MPSIYKRICAEYRKSRTLPYDFMPTEIGASSVTAAQHNEIPVSLREVCARRTLRAAFEGGEWSIIEPIWFAHELRQEISRRIAGGSLTAADVSRCGMQLAMNSENAHAVEAGMLMMGFGCDDLIQRVMERLALHSKFTLIGIYATADWPNANDRIFRWMKLTADCGSVVCAMMLRPETDEQRRWLVYEGLKNARPQSEMARCILRRPSMMEYIQQLPDSAETFHALCRLICYAPPIEEKAQVNALVLKLMHGLSFAAQYVDLCAMHKVQRILLGPQDELYAEWVERCDPLRAKLRRQGVIEAEFDNPGEGAELMVLALTGEGITPPLERFMRMMAVQELPPALLRFLLLYHGDIYAARLLECMMKVSPKTLFSDPPSIRDCRELPDGKYDFWLAIALSSMCGEPALDAPTAVKCLSARSVAVRAAAVQCLNALDDPMPQSTEQELRKAISQEPDAELRKRMMRLLDGMNREPVPHTRVSTANVDPEALRRCALGDSLRYVEITGRERYNCCGVRELAREGERLLLTAHASDPDVALAVTSGGVVIGELELDASDSLLRDLLAAGEPLVAVLEGTLYMEHAWVEIRRPLRPLTLPGRGNVYAFPVKK